MKSVQGTRLLLILTMLVMPAAGLSQGSGHGAGQANKPDPALRQALIKAVNDSNSFDDRFHAEVWLTDMSSRMRKRLPDTQQRLELLRTVHHEAKRARLHPELVLAVIDVESNFDRYAISYVGARGLMQIMPFWLDEIGRPNDNLFDMQTNLRFGCTILRHYMDRESDDIRRALARYNGSVGKRKYPDKVFKVLGSRWYKQ